MCNYLCGLKKITVCSYCTVTKTISAALPQTQYSTYRWEFRVFSCCVLSVKSCSFIPSDSCHFRLWAGVISLCFQQSSMLQVSTSVLLLVSEIDCVTCFMGWGWGGHFELCRGRRRRKLKGRKCVHTVNQPGIISLKLLIINHRTL